MKFIPKELNKNVNISKRAPIKDFFILLGGILGVLVCIYIILGFAVDFLAPRIPPALEKKIYDIHYTKFR